jgi:hypothetical protein
MMLTRGVIALAAALAAWPAAADSKLEGRYDLSLAGIEVGKAAIVLEINRDSYSAAGSAQVTGIARIFTSSRGTAAARGKILGHQVVPHTYSMTAESKKRSDEVRIVMADGSVREYTAFPAVSPRPDRVPLTEAHRKDVLDPMSAALTIAPGTGEVMSPDVCKRTLPIFDGRYRYEVELKFLRIEHVSGARGYAGPALVCEATYRPIAGHRPLRKAAVSANGTDEVRVWLVPVAGTRALVPYRVTVGTTYGTFMLQATLLRTEPKERASATPPKPQ